MKKDEAYVELEAMKMIMPLKVGLEGSKFPKEWESPKIPKAPKEFQIINPLNPRNLQQDPLNGPLNLSI